MIRRYFNCLRALFRDALNPRDPAEIMLDGVAEMRRRIWTANQGFSAPGTLRPSVLVTFAVDVRTRGGQDEFASLIKFCRRAATADGAVGWLDRSRLAVLIPDANRADVGEFVRGLSTHWGVAGEAESLGRFGPGRGRWQLAGFSKGKTERWRAFRQPRPGSRRRLGRRLVKRGCDSVVAAVGLIVLSPVILLLALTVKLSSPGPIFYADQRFGRRGRPCHIYRFRDRAAETPGMLAQSDDGRHLGSDGELVEVLARTPVGSFLHDTHLDRLPQLWNVLRGDLSL